MIAPMHASLHGWLASNEAALRDHIVSSTLILFVLLALSMLPSLRPRTRYALVLLGVAKFLVPGTLLSAVFGRLFVRDAALPSLSISVVFALPSRTSPQSELLCLVFLVWFVGAIVMAWRFVAAQLRWSSVARAAGIVSDRERRAMDSVVEGSLLRTAPRLMRAGTALPLTAGVLDPVILLPDSCTDLDDDELRAVLAHELAHAERRHNLAGVVQTIALALFWFNPALWIARRRLHDEAEKDCDERVLNFVPDAPTYLSGMLKVSYGFIAPQPAGVSCMSTSQLKERMDHLMKHQKTPRPSIPHRLAVVMAVLAVALTTLMASAGERAKPVPAGKNGVTLPKVVSKVEPVYPDAAREKRVQGIVVLKAVVDETGIVTGTSVVKGIEGAEGKALEEAAAAAVKQWKFEPAQKHGKPVTVTFKLTVRFKLS